MSHTVKLQVINYALVHLGMEPTTQLDVYDAGISALKAVFDVEYQRFLSKTNWNFAQKEAELSLISQQNPGDFLYRYAFPSDCIRAIELSDKRFSYKVWGEQIATSMPSARLLYIANVNIEKLPVKHIPAFGLQLAVILSSNSTLNSAAQKQLTIALADKALQDAMFNDAVEDTPQAKLVFNDGTEYLPTVYPLY